MRSGNENDSNNPRGKDAYLIKTFVVQNHAGDRQFADLPLSPELREAVEALRLKVLGQLNELSEKVFVRSPPSRRRLITELQRFIEEANRTLDPERVPAPANEPCTPEAELVRPTGLHDDSHQTRRILIPEPVRKTPFSRFKLSSRLRRILACREFEVLGDIHGIPLSYFRSARNCGRGTLRELQQLVERVRKTAEKKEAKGSPIRRDRPVPAGCLWVGSRALSVRPADVFMSVRLDHILRRKGIKRLGQLHGMEERELLESGNCGRKTLGELKALLRRASSGVFEVKEQEIEQSPPSELLKTLDDLVARLPGSDQEVLREKFGGREPRTLKAVGDKRGVTRERVRQKLGKSFEKIQRMGGLILQARVRRATEEQPGAACPWSREVFEAWHREQAEHLKESPLFYLRLVAALREAAVMA